MASYMLASCQAVDLRIAGSDRTHALDISQCKTYPVYQFVRHRAGTELLRETEEQDVPSAGEYTDKVYDLLEMGLGDLVLVLERDLA